MKRLIVGCLALLVLGATAVAAFAAESPNTVWLCLELQIICEVNLLNLEVITLYDLGVGSGVECASESVSGSGSVGGTEGTVTSVTFEVAACKPTATGLNTKEEPVTNACKEVTEVEALHVPWNTVIELEGGVAWNLLLESGTHGLPGYLLLCLIVGGTKQNDECLASAAHTPLVELQNLLGGPTEPPLVSSYFPANPLEKAELAKCSVGGAESGLVLGETLIEALQGGVAVSLELSNEE